MYNFEACESFFEYTLVRKSNFAFFDIKDTLSMAEIRKKQPNSSHFSMVVLVEIAKVPKIDIIGNTVQARFHMIL